MRRHYPRLLFRLSCVLLCSAWPVATLITGAVAGESAVKTLKVDHGISAEGRNCVECHAQKSPGIVADR